MIVVTTSNIHDKRVVKTFGMVRGSTVRGKHLGKDLIAWLRNLVGGEINEYTKMLAESREQALDRMMQDATQIRVVQIGSTNVGTAQVSPTQVGACQIRLVQVAPRKVRVTQVSIFKIGIAKIRAR